jgi:hypothetical protein
MFQVGDIVTARFNYLLTGIVVKIENVTPHTSHIKNFPAVSIRWFGKDSDVVYRTDSIKKVS